MQSRCIHTVPLCIETYSQFQSIWNNVYIFYSVLKGSTIKCYLWQKFHFQCYICSILVLNHTRKLTPSTDDFFILLHVASRLLHVKSVKQPKQKDSNNNDNDNNNNNNNNNNKNNNNDNNNNDNNNNQQQQQPTTTTTTTTTTTNNRNNNNKQQKQQSLKQGTEHDYI